jgi:hypothetical protein
MKSKIILVISSILLLCLLPHCCATLNADNQDNLGQIELRPAEKTAEDLFGKFGNHPWVGGDPWASQKNMALTQLQTKKVQKETTGPAISSSAKVGDNLSYYLIGILNTTQLLLSDICISNQSCELNSSLSAPGGTYNVFMVMNDSKYAGLWVELE